MPPSEFVGLSYEEQYKKIKKGLDILEQNGVKSDIWMAPSNSFDRITLKALKNLGFKYVTYGIALFPYQQEGLQFIPQPLWGPEAISAGITTIALHTNWCDDEDLAKLEKFIMSGIETISFRDACESSTSKAEHLLNALYMVYYILFRMKNALKRKLFRE